MPTIPTTILPHVFGPATKNPKTYSSCFPSLLRNCCPPKNENLSIVLTISLQGIHQATTPPSLRLLVNPATFSIGNFGICEYFPAYSPTFYSPVNRFSFHLSSSPFAKNYLIPPTPPTNPLPHFHHQAHTTASPASTSPLLIFSHLGQKVNWAAVCLFCFFTIPPVFYPRITHKSLHHFIISPSPTDSDSSRTHPLHLENHQRLRSSHQNFFHLRSSIK